MVVKRWSKRIAELSEPKVFTKIKHIEAAWRCANTDRA
jgi:hypothetical protein